MSPRGSPSALVVRPLEQVGNLPPGLSYELPERIALGLIMRRKAQAIGSLGALADLTLTEEECREAGIE